MHKKKAQHNNNKKKTKPQDKTIQMRFSNLCI